MKIKREIWGRKFFIVSRKDNGQLIERVKWTKKNIDVKFIDGDTRRTKWTLKEAIKRQNQYNSISPTREVFKWTQTKEVTELGRNVRKPNKSFMVWVKIRADGFITQGKSNKYDSDFSKIEARNEAIYNALSQANPSGNSDIDTANKLFENKNFTIINEGIVYYDKI